MDFSLPQECSSQEDPPQECSPPESPALESLLQKIPQQACPPLACPPLACPPRPVKVVYGTRNTFWHAESLPTFHEICLHSSQCPKKHWLYTMFHGTTYAAAVEIIKHGFKQSADGMLGRGVYVSRDIHKAMKYPLNNDPRKVVLKLRVNVGKVKKIDYPNHPLQKTWNAHGYNTAWVPPHTMNPSGQEEDCVFNPQRIKVIDIVHGNPDDVKKLKRLLHHH
ncbi:uncharacterized protein LOC130293809 [Hyla sarda]|uniref:uncharacterized protein LOC130293809 n=1 Tax=Hyla sarda TaxID=327740 RepID=UPI0024C2BB31|nr:uncharacterized protein LOC130293809 [Hyla sarda]